MYFEAVNFLFLFKILVIFLAHAVHTENHTYSKIPLNEDVSLDYAFHDKSKPVEKIKAHDDKYLIIVVTNDKESEEASKPATVIEDDLPSQHNFENFKTDKLEINIESINSQDLSNRYYNYKDLISDTRRAKTKWHLRNTKLDKPCNNTANVTVKQHKHKKKEDPDNLVREHHKKHVNEIMTFLIPNMMSTRYIHDEIRRIKHTNEIRDKLRRIVYVAEHEPFKSLYRDDLLKCYDREMKLLNTHIQMWDHPTNDLVMNPLKLYEGDN